MSVIRYSALAFVPLTLLACQPQNAEAPQNNTAQVSGNALDLKFEKITLENGLDVVWLWRIGRDEYTHWWRRHEWLYDE